MKIERRFGVEIEHFMPRGDSAETARVLRAAKLAQWADRTSEESQYPVPPGCGYGVETRSPILKGEDGFKKLERVLTVLKDAGAKVTTGSGTHIHHDAPEFRNNKALCLLLIESWSNNRKLIERFVAHRRRNGNACPNVWTKQRVAQYKQPRPAWQRDYYDRYDRDEAAIFYGHRGDLNLSSLREHGSIEIRLHEGTLDYEEIRAWILFGQYFINSVSLRKRPFECPDEANLLNRVRVPKAAQRKLLGKANPAMVVM